MLRRPAFLVSIVVVVAAAGGGYYFWQQRGDTATLAARPAVAVPVQVIAVKAGLIRSVLTYSGAIQASQQVSVSPRATGQLVAVKVEVGQQVRQGEQIAQVDPGTLPAQVAQGQASVASAHARLELVLAGPRATDVSSARATLDAAQAKLDQLIKPSASDVAAQDSAVATAKAAADNAVNTVSSTKTTLIGSIYVACNQGIGLAVSIPCNNLVLPLPKDVVDNASSYLVSGVGQIGLSPGTNALAVLTANAAYVAALNNQVSLQQALVSAQAKRDVLVSPTVSDVAAQRSAVETARNTLDSKTTPYTNADIEAARATLAQAVASLAASQASFDQTNIIAPFDGVIAQRLREAGATVTTQTPVVTLLARVLEVHLTVDEARLGQMKQDLDVELTVPSFPGKTFKGKVATISPLGDARAHTFDVKAFVDDPTQQLRAGMFAQAGVVVSTKPNAVLVPNGAIAQQTRGNVVFIVVDGKAVQKVVKLGIVDETNSEITDGIAAGDQVVTVGQNVLRDGQAVQVRPAAGAPGAGGPGAGAPGGGGQPGSGAGAGTPAAGGTVTPGVRPSGTAGAGGGAGQRPSGSATPTR